MVNEDLGCTEYYKEHPNKEATPECQEECKKRGIKDAECSEFDGCACIIQNGHIP